MKKSNNIIIIGCNISSLYAAIKCIDNGHKVQIIERKNSVIPVYDASYHNYSLYNDNHRVYMSLLKRFDIKTAKLDIEFNEKFKSIIKNVIYKSQLIPNNVLMTYSFRGLYQSLMSIEEINELNKYDNIFGGLFDIINALDFINILNNDIMGIVPIYQSSPRKTTTQQCDTSIQYYYVSLQCINELISKMIAYIYAKGGKILYNHDVKTIKYIKRKFVIGTTNHNMFNSDMIITTISKYNLSMFTFWNNTQLSLLNTVAQINASHIKNMLHNIMSFKEHDDNSEQVRTLLLERLHIVYPSCTKKDKNIYVWIPGTNNVLIREKIKSMYNNHFIICSESFSKNNMFINYSLECIDSMSNLRT
jgi:hypothetical protein